MAIVINKPLLKLNAHFIKTALIHYWRFDKQCIAVDEYSNIDIAVITNGIIGTLGYFLRFFASYRLEPEIYAPLSYFGVVMSYVYGIAFDNEILNWKKVLGTISILASNYFVPKWV